MMKKTLALCLALIGPAALAQSTELFVSISSPHAMAQGAGLVLAGQALAQKAPVRILLCDAAGDIALQAAVPAAPLKPRNVTPQQLLQAAIQGGAKVEVCALYLPNKGLQPTDLISGVAPAKPAEVAATLLKPGVQTLSF